MRIHRIAAAVLPLTTLLSAACAVDATGPEPPAAVMLGEWTYRSEVVPPDGPSLNAGLRVTIAVDSVDGTRFWGRVELWFAGDVGMPPGMFGAVSGEFDTRGAVTVLIPLSHPVAHVITIRGRVAVDILTVTDSRNGTAPGPFPAGASFQRH